MLTAEKKEADETIAEWRSQYNLAIKKMKATFPICTLHLEAYQPFHDKTWSFYAMFETNSLDNFDTKNKIWMRKQLLGELQKILVLTDRNMIWLTYLQALSMTTAIGTQMIRLIQRIGYFLSLF